MVGNIDEPDKSVKGFTIIEVLIVLAVAGLILLIVFMAVPALQRNARNRQTATEANLILLAISELKSNSNSFSLNTTGGWIWCIGKDDVVPTNPNYPSCGYTATTNIAQQIWQVNKTKNIIVIVVLPNSCGSYCSIKIDTTNVVAVGMGGKCQDSINNDGTLPTLIVSSPQELYLAYATEKGDGTVLAHCIQM